MVKKLFFCFCITLLLFACKSADQFTQRTTKGVNTAEKLSRHTLEFEKKIYQVTENIYSAVGFGLANSIMIEGEDGLIIVDTMETNEEAAKVLAEFRKISDKPVKAIIYTHNHVDHVMGAKTLADGGNPEIYAHETTDYYVQRIVNKMRPIIGTRSMRMFGNYLDQNGLVNAGIGPFLGVGAETTAGYLKPTKTFSHEMDVTLAGVKLKLIHAAGETNDQIYVFVEDQNLLMCGDNYYRTFPNLYTIRGTPFRSLKNWYKSIDIIRDLRPEHLVPSHSRPVSGTNKIYSILTDYRDAIQFVHDQGIRGINQGMTPDELVEYIKLPEHLASSPYLQEFYGKVSWSLRALFVGNLGWFSGDSADLQPLSRNEQDRLMADLAGGEENLLAKAENYAEKGAHQTVLQLTGHLLRLDSKNSAAKTLRINALMALGQKEENSNARHYYLTEAIEIRDGILASENVKPSPELLSQFPLESFFTLIAVSLDAGASSDMDKQVGIRFTDVDQAFTIHVRRGVAEIRNGLPAPDDADILVNAESGAFKAMLAKLRSPVITLAGFDYEKGNALLFGMFLKMFDPPGQKLAYQMIED